MKLKEKLFVLSKYKKIKRRRLPAPPAPRERKELRHVTPRKPKEEDIMADIELLVEYAEQLEQNWQEALKLLRGRVNNPDLSEVMRALQANLYLTTETCQELKAQNEELQRQIEHLSTSGRNLQPKTKKMITDLLWL